MALPLKQLGKFFDASGRIGRLSFLVRFFAGVLLVFPMILLVSLGGSSQEGLAVAYRTLVGLTAFALVVALQMSTTSKRLHDLGYASGWSFLLLFPGLNALVFLICLVASPNNIGNKYGAEHSG